MGYERFIGDLYRAGGHGVERNWALARDWYARAVADSDHSAEPLLGQLYEEGGPGLPRDWERACFYYRMAGVRQAAAADRVCSD